ncbi:ceramide synthase 2 [Biomphalaria glabrata]|uniref:Ceramide synthase 2-like n=1 Tax=Biomphalaria glabrata TaxID=6526 RepID=A0A2C9LMB2_BIOGL|nr:ceramide synthase 2-like [Biomphalaria glabrata]KAI8769836.1 ceramide synthase 2-like [Biomphalaria glabrata]
MATYGDVFHNFIWNEKFWLGDDARWDDFISSDPSVYYPKISHMNWSIVVGVLLMFVRFIYESYLIKPLAQCLGLKERKKLTLKESPSLEAAYKSYRSKVPQHEILRLSKETNMTERQIQRWLFKRRIIQMPSSMYKFKECSWQVLFYSLSFGYGLYALWDKPWLWVTVNCWVGWPKQHIDNDIFILYLVELGFYWSLLFAVFFQRDYQKKDKKEMVLHHMVTILLIYFSWGCNFVRVGSLVLIVHDFADPWLNIAKMAKYTKHQTTCEFFFAVFIITWIVSRLFIYPFWVLNASAVEIHDYVTTFPAYWFFNGLLFVLQLLHIMWTYLLLTVAFQKFTLGSIEKDIRSESDSELSDSTNEEHFKNNVFEKNRKTVTNGVTQKVQVNKEKKP